LGQKDERFAIHEVEKFKKKKKEREGRNVISHKNNILEQCL